MSAVPLNIGKLTWKLAEEFSKETSRGSAEFFTPLINYVYFLWEEVEEQNRQGIHLPVGGPLTNVEHKG